MTVGKVNGSTQKMAFVILMMTKFKTDDCNVDSQEDHGHRGLYCNDKGDKNEDDSNNSQLMEEVGMDDEYLSDALVEQNLPVGKIKTRNGIE